MSLQALEATRNTVLVFDFIAEDGSCGRGHFTSQPYKQLNLPDSELSLKAEDRGSDIVVLTVECRQLALYVMLEADVPGQFSHNVLLLLPGESQEIEFFHSGDTSDYGSINFTLRDLYSSYADTPLTTIHI